MTTTLRLRGPADVLAVLPYQLGFHPSDSFVAVSLRGTRMGLVQRIDLPPREHVAEAVEALLPTLLRDEPSAVLLIGFEPAAGRSAPMLEEMARACTRAGIDVSDRLVVRDGRWFAPDCPGSGCCPVEGMPMPAADEVPAVAEFVGREVSPLADRQALEDRLRPTRPLLVRAVGACVDELLDSRLEAFAFALGAGALQRRRARELEVWSRVVDHGDEAVPVGQFRPEDLALLVVSLADFEMRDGLIAWLCPGTLSMGLIEPALRDQMGALLPPPIAQLPSETEEVVAWQRIERRLGEVCASVPEDWAVSVLCVLGSFTWWRGDGALTRIALERALSIDPGYRLAGLMLRMVDLAIRPSRASA